MAKSTTTSSVEVFICPACEAPVYGRISVQFTPELASVSNKTLNLTGTVVGLEVSHDCTPKVTR